MTATRRVAATRLAGLALALCLLAIQVSFSAMGIVDPDEAEKSGGRPMPRPDAPAAAVAFRQLQWRDERGSYRVNAFVEAKAHADAMRARARGLRLEAAGTSLIPGSAVEGVAGGGPDPLPLAAGTGPGSWTWLGPGNIGGRVRSLVINPTNANVMFAGGVAGGLFTTTNGGASWAPVDDFMANLAISTIVMQPGLPTTIYAGTGEGFYNTDGIRGAGVFTSTDGGVVWTQLAATANANWWYVNRLAIAPNGGAMLAATRSGIFRSTNGGASWTATTPAEMTYVAFHPTDSTKAIASGYAGDAYVSTNGGATWTAATGLPGGAFTRVELAYARGTPAVVYASVDVNGGSIYKSTNGGASFSVIFNGAPDYLATQGWYGSALWVDPTNERTLIVGGIDLWKSTDGGVSLKQISNWAATPASPHADQHVIVEQPGFNGSSNTAVWFANDGGVYHTDNVYTAGGGAAPYTLGWSVVNNNLGITQFYGASGNASTGLILGGTQDNGTLKYSPATGTSWSTEFGGDGGATAVDPFNGDNLYGEYSYGSIHRSTDGGATADWINGAFWNGTQYECKPAPYLIADTCGAARSNFVAPLILDPNDSNRLYVGGASLWRTDEATAPNTISTGPRWTNVKGPAGQGNHVSAIAVAAGDANAIWIGHNAGQLFKTINGLADVPTWTAVGVGTLPARFVTRVRVDPANADIVYVTYGGFSGSNVWRTTDGGASWAPAAGTGATALPPAPVRDLAISVLQPTSLYAATEVGLFTSQDSGSTWTVPQDGPANVSVEELFWMGPSLVAVTHGRGLFKTTPTLGRLTPVITWPTPQAITYGTALDAMQLSATANVPGTFVYTPPSGTILPAGGGRTLSVLFSPTDVATYDAVTAAVQIAVSQATPTITWNAPAGITYGTTLSGAQLNATASVPGTFVYTPAIGATLPAGPAQTLSATFTPADSANYIAVTRSVAIAVAKATPTISWSAPAGIVYGTALSAVQLNATASVPGTFVYAPPLGTVLPAGLAQPLSVTFTPSDAVNYTTATASRTIAVAKATPTITWNPPASIVFGAALTSAQLNATASTPGSFVYSPPAGTVLSVGANQPLAVTFQPADPANYTTSTATVFINVLAVGIPAIDAQVWTDRASAQSTVVSPAFSTTAANELVLAFVSTDFGSGTNTSVTGVTGAGLTWVLVGRTNVQRGTSEIWRAFAAAPLTAVTVTATLSQPVSSMITVVSFANVDTSGTNGSGAIGAIASTNSSRGAPTATLVTTRNNSWVFGVGNDYDTASARTLGTGQTMVHQYLAPVGDTYWVQRTLTTTPLAGTSVTINDTAPAGDRYNLLIAEIRSAAVPDTTAPSVSLTAPAGGANVSGAAVTVSAAASDNVAVTGVQFKLDGLDLGAEDLSSPYTVAWDTTKVGNGTHSLTAVARDGAGNTATSAAVAVQVSNPVAITWTTPASILYGTALSATQLNATASVPGTFVYAPPAGTVLNAGAAQTLSVTFTPTDTVNYSPATASVAMTVLKAAPTLTWSAPADITYGTALGATQLSATASVPGTFTYSPPAGTILSAGAGQALSVIFTPADVVNYASATAGVTIAVSKATPSMTWNAPADISSGTALSAAQLNASASVPGTFVYDPPSATVLAPGSHTLLVVFTPTDVLNYTTATASVPIAVGKPRPTITWNAPADIVFGMALSAAQLNATASVPGTFVYTPPAGTMLNAGDAQVLSVTFTPTDAVNYSTATASLEIRVLKAPLTLTWTTPANITYGNALSTTQLNATASVPGTFVYTPPAGTVLNAGTAEALSVIFSPIDTINYLSAIATVSITVEQVTPTITWGGPAPIVSETALSAAQLNATASVPGTFVYTPPTGTVLKAGSGQRLSVVFTPADGVNYTTASAGVEITVGQKTPAITWTAPGDIVYGTALSAAQLNATSIVPGTFVYVPPAGTVLNAGADQPLSVTFTPSDPVDYSTATANTAIIVKPAVPAIAWSAPKDIAYGTALGAAQLNATAAIPGTFAYAPAAATVLDAGAGQALSVTFTPSDTVNYTSATASVPITVLRSLPALTWNAPANITYGTALGAAQLNASSSVPGTFGYAPPAGTVLPAGAAQPLSVTFTPFDAANYLTATASRTITVAKATPALFWNTPASVMPGTALSATQLNATASVPGAFVYTPPAGTVLNAGSNQVLQVAFTPTDLANYTTATATVLINVVTAAPLAIDAQVWTDRASAQSTVVSPAFSTTAANELVLAFVSTDFGSGTNTSVTGVTGAGLTWVLVGRTNVQRGTSEIWRAFAAAPLTAVTVTATLSQPVSSMITVVSFANVDTSGTNGSGAIGAIASTNSSRGAPTATLVTTRDNSWLFGVGNDYDTASARTLGTGQTMVHQYLAPVGDTYWVQRRTTTTPLAGTSVTINDTSPSGDRYNLFVVEIRPSTGADTTAPTASLTVPAAGATVSGAAVTVTAAANDNVAVSGVQFLLDDVNLGAEDPTSPYSIVWDTTKVANGSHALKAVARDGAGNTATSAVVMVTVDNPVADLTPPIVTMTAPAAGSTVLGPAVTVSANASDNVGVAGVQFLVDGAALGAEVAVAPFTTTWSTTAVSNGAHTLAARARDAANNLTTSEPVIVTVSNPVTITWSTPAAIVYGAALSATQLNAAASVPGTFSYAPPAGTVLSAGAAQVLSVTFTPTDVNYAPATANVTITVLQASPVLTWGAPASIVYGTPVDATQLNATASIPGTFVFTPAAGTILQAGAGQALSVAFTPTDAVNYTSATAGVTIAVLRATPAITWVGPAPITAGTALSAAQLNATASVSGTFLYTPPAGTVLNAGASQVLSVTFTPTDLVNYTPATAGVTITVLGATPAIDAVVWADEALARSTITSPAFSTTASNELVLAFISTDYNGGVNTTVTSVTGGGLTWVLVARTNVQLGSSEIWRAFATAPLTGATVTASMSQPVSSMLTVVSFSNVDTTGSNGAGAIGATAMANRASGAPTATLVTTRNNSWVFGVGNDFDRATARTVAAGQTMVHQYLAAVGDTYWVQRTSNVTPLAGTSVTINDTAPTADRSNLTICEIRPPQ